MWKRVSELVCICPSVFVFWLFAYFINFKWIVDIISYCPSVCLFVCPFMRLLSYSPWHKCYDMSAQTTTIRWHDDMNTYTYTDIRTQEIRIKRMALCVCLWIRERLYPDLLWRYSYSSTQWIIQAYIRTHIRTHIQNNNRRPINTVTIATNSSSLPGEFKGKKSLSTKAKR